MSPRHAAALPFLIAATASAQVDLILSEIPDVHHNGVIGGIHAYAVGFTVCNAGTEHAVWQSQTNQHPVEGWGMFRIAGGRIEQIGASWLKHGNFAASVPGCGTCDTRINGNRLGTGCRDTYNAMFNASEFGLGARSDVNAFTGAFPYPPTGWGLTGNDIYKLCQVRQADLANPGALYLVEGAIVHPQDAAAGKGNNNASYRTVNVDRSSFVATVTSQTQVGSPAILAWRDLGNNGQPDPDVLISTVDIPGDGRIFVASKATNLGNGLWHYEYAVENLNSHRSVGSFSVLLPTGSPALNPGFHDVDAHSGEPTDSTDWPFERTACGTNWHTAPFAANPNANAIRWGTLYNFRFDSPLPPTQGHTTLGLFRPGTPAAVSALAIVPAGARSADINSDGFLDGFDYDDFVDAFESGDAHADFNADLFIDGFDYDDFVTAFEFGCV